MQTIYDIDYFIKKFEAIPEDKFTTKVYRDSFDYTKRCFLGHCIKDETIDKHDFYNGGSLSLSIEESNEISHLVLFFDADRHIGTQICYAINNGNDKRYQQPTPKQRILAALYDIKAMQATEQVQAFLNATLYSHVISK